MPDPAVRFGTEGVERVLQRVRLLLATPRGTLPLDREFGLSWHLVDRPAPRAAAALRAEIAEQLVRYEPGVRLLAVEVEADAQAGVIRPRLRLSVAGEVLTV